MNRSPSSAWAAASRATYMARKRSGSFCVRAGPRWERCRRIGGRGSMTARPRPPPRCRAPPDGARSWPTSTLSTRSSSRSRRGKPPRSIPSSVCCWRWRTRPWSMPAFAADSLRRTQTGVFAGACVGEYGSLASTDLSQVDAWSGTGGALSIIANRVSYFFDLRGPSVAVDTACSSSLVAVHLACQSLRTGDSESRHRGRREPAAVTGGHPQLRSGTGDVADGSVSCFRRDRRRFRAR